jgi:large subunit ribosomal protein L10
MSKRLKVLVAGELSSRFTGVKDCVVVDYTRVTALESDDLRRELRKVGAKMEVVKNRLATRAFESIGLGELNASLSGPCALVYGADIAAASKVLKKWSADHNKLTVRGGVLGLRRIAVTDVARLAELPPLEVLRARAASLVLSPVVAVMYAVQAVPSRIAVAVDAIRKQKEEASATVASAAASSASEPAAPAEPASAEASSAPAPSAAPEAQGQQQVAQGATV